MAKDKEALINSPKPVILSEAKDLQRLDLGRFFGLRPQNDRRGLNRRFPKASGLAFSVVVCVLGAFLAVALLACSTTDESDAQAHEGLSIVDVDVEDLSGGVAATVNGVDLGENAITAYISNFRYSQDLLDQEAWGQWVFDAGYTMDGLRAETVNHFVNQELIRQAAAARGVTVADWEVEEQYQQSMASVGEGEFAKTLKEQGYNERNYRDEIRDSILQRKLMEQEISSEPVSDEDVAEYLKAYVPDSIDPEAENLDGVEETVVEDARSAIESGRRTSAFADWVEKFEEESEVLTRSMPEGLPYVVDLTPYEEAANAEVQATIERSENNEG